MSNTKVTAEEMLWGSSPQYLTIHKNASIYLVYLARPSILPRNFDKAPFVYV